MQITETGYYETRDGGLAWVYPRTPFTIAEHNNPIDGYARYGDQWEFKTWLENGKESKDQTNDKDLIRYIGKELPEEKPQPERVELSKLWVGWYQTANRIGTTLYTTDKESLKSTPGILAITPAGATGFTPGEGLE